MEPIKIYEILREYSSYIIYLGLLVFLFRSKAILFHLIWERLLNKSFEISDNKLSEVVKDQLDLERMRMLFPKFKLQNLYQAKALQNWCNKHKVGYEQTSIFEEQISYDEFSEEKIEFKMPSFIKVDVAFMSAILIILYLTFVSALFIPFISGWNGSILLKGKTSHAYFWINKDKTAESAFFWNKEWNIIGKECSIKPAEASLTDKEYSTICQIVNSEENLKTYFTNSKRESLTAMLIILPALSLLMYSSVRSVKKIILLKSFNKHIKKSKENLQELESRQSIST